MCTYIDIHADAAEKADYEEHSFEKGDEKGEREKIVAEKDAKEAKDRRSDKRYGIEEDANRNSIFYPLYMYIYTYTASPRILPPLFERLFIPWGREKDGKCEYFSIKRCSFLENTKDGKRNIFSPFVLLPHILLIEWIFHLIP